MFSGAHSSGHFLRWWFWFRVLNSNICKHLHWSANGSHATGSNDFYSVKQLNIWLQGERYRRPNIVEFAEIVEIFAENLRNLERNFLRYRRPVQRWFPISSNVPISSKFFGKKLSAISNPPVMLKNEKKLLKLLMFQLEMFREIFVGKSKISRFNTGNFKKFSHFWAVADNFWKHFCTERNILRLQFEHDWKKI